MTVKIGYFEGLAGCLHLTPMTSNMPWSMEWYKGQVSTEECRPVTLIFSRANKISCMCLRQPPTLQYEVRINPLKPELNPICYLLALLGAHHFLHVSRIRVKSLTFRLLMS